MNTLGVGLDYLMLEDNKVRGDVRQRQLDYAKSLDSLTLVVYSPKELNLQPQQWAANLWAYPTNSRSRMTFVSDAYKMAAKICKERRIDAITTEDPFTTGLVGYLLKIKFRIPLNVQAHIDFVDNKYWMQLRGANRFFNILGKFICNKADTIRVVASETKESLEKRGIDPEKVSLISVHSTLGHFAHSNDTGLREEFLKKEFDRILLFVGRLVDQKDIPNLFSAFKLILKKRPRTLLLVAGQGPKREYLEQLAKKKCIDSNIIFTGSIAHSEIQRYYAASDIFVLPSIFEGRATVLVEAILSRKPIVTTDVSGLKEWLIDNETGFIVKRRDPKAFADKVIYLLDNPELAASFGEKGYELAKNRLKEISDTSSMIKLWEKTAGMKIGDGR